ncbi:hypothetical protein QJS10_CPA03g00937 [Acorus calamus]|uniref:Cytochrome P450 n=1 Tax=Acorus calamus TaxID=4465 RepID=A0AAV9F543_ACOCL|nr:hypothetical protein QJS10_CPA03g00937 [Acorus calamus]
MSSLIKRYLVKGVEGKDSVSGLILLKKIAFKGGWVLPIYLPFTHYYRAIAARRRIYDRFSTILDERRRRLEDGSLIPNDDIVTAMLTMRDEEGRAMPRPEILDNLITVMFASHDTVVSLNASFVQRLAMDEVTLECIYEEVDALQSQLTIKELGIQIVRTPGESKLPKKGYKLVKGAMLSFLKAESLQHYIGQMDDVVRTQLLSQIKDGDTIKAVTLMKKLTFNVTCSLLFGLYDEPMKEALFEDFSQAFKGVWSVPVDFPGHRIIGASNRGLGLWIV